MSRPWISEPDATATSNEDAYAGVFIPVRQDAIDNLPLIPDETTATLRTLSVKSLKALRDPPRRGMYSEAFKSSLVKIGSVVQQHLVAYEKLVLLPSLLGFVLRAVHTEKQPNSLLKEASLVLLEVGRVIEDTLDSAEFMSLVAPSSVVRLVQAFLTSWVPTAVKLRTYLSGVHNEYAVIQLIEVRGQLLTSVEEIIAELSRSQCAPPWHLQWLSRVCPHVNANTTHGVYTIAHLLLLFVFLLLNLMLLAISVAVGSLEVSLISGGFILAAALLLCLRERRDGMDIVQTGLLGLSYHQLLLPLDWVDAGLFTPLWVIAYTFTLHRIRDRLLLLALRVGAFLAFCKIRSIRDDPVPTATVISISLATVVWFPVAVLAKLLVMRVYKTRDQSIRYEPHYRKLALSQIDDPPARAEAQKEVLQEMKTISVLVSPLLESKDTNTAETANIVMDVIDKQLKASPRPLSTPSSSCASPNRDILTLKRSINTNPLQRAYRKEGDAKTKSLEELTKTLDATATDVTGDSIFLSITGVCYHTPADAALRLLAVLALDADFIVMHWNEKMAMCTGIDPKEMLGENLLTYLNDEEHQARLEASMIEALTGETSTPTIISIRSGHRDVMLMLTFQPARVSGGMPGRCLVVGYGVDLAYENYASQYVSWLYNSLKGPVHASHRALEAGADFSVAKPFIDSAVKILMQYEPLCHSMVDVSFSSWGVVNINSLCADLGSAFASDNMVTLKIDVDTNAASDVVMDRQRTYQVLLFLLNYTAEKVDGRIELSISEVEAHAGVSSLRFDLTGWAIDEVTENIFDPSWSPALAKVKLGVKQMGGNITYKNGAFSIATPCIVSTQMEVGEHTNIGGPSSLVVIENVIEKRPILHAMWRRGHAAVAASYDSDINMTHTDIVVLDMHEKRAHYLLPHVKVRKDLQAILLYEKDVVPDANLARRLNVHILEKPVRLKKLNEVLRQAEAALCLFKKEEEALNSLRETFGEGGCPWTRIGRLGKGAFSEVYKARNLFTRGVMAVKVIDVSEKSDAELKHVLNEVQLLSQHRHTCIVHYFYCEKNDTELHIFMEYAPGGSLGQLIRSYGHLDKNTTGCCMSDILSALSYLHEQNVIHRDIKSENILLTANGTCKMSDFGCAIQPSDGDITRRFVGTPSYMAPEVINEVPYTVSVDVWSVGVLTCEMLTGDIPWAKAADNWLKMARHIGMLQSNEEIDFPDLAPTELDFVKTCLQVDPAQRGTAMELSVHELFDNLNRDDMLVPEMGSDEELQQSVTYLAASHSKPVSPRSDAHSRMRRSDDGLSSGSSVSSLMSYIPRSQEVAPEHLKIKRRSTCHSYTRTRSIHKKHEEMAWTISSNTHLE